MEKDDSCEEVPDKHVVLKTLQTLVPSGRPTDMLISMRKKQNRYRSEELNVKVKNVCFLYRNAT